MKVTLIDHTGMGHPDPDHAINVLIFTKSTRLTMSPGLFSEIAAWPREKKLSELEYMANTIPSSWEFVNYTFMVEGVSRGFTHQYVRSREFSFAQQTMRVLDVSSGPGWEYHTGPTIDNNWDDEGNTREELYIRQMKAIDETYKRLIASGVAIEDARGILPTNILTNIVGKCNMRTFVELVRKRSSPRTQSEYRDVLEAMKEAVRAVHPWIDLFIDRTFDRAANELCAEIAAFDPYEMLGSTVGGSPAIDTDKLQAFKTRLIKLTDQMRGQS
jgi:flavin-dependent thymidylate synthase